MDSWTEVARIPATLAGSAVLDSPHVSALKFDSALNLLWCGDTDGYTRSFTPQTHHGANPYQHAFQLYPYTRFKSSAGPSPVRQYLNHKDGILSLSNNNVNFNSRRGACRLSVSSESFGDAAGGFSGLSCMTTNCNTLNDIVVGTKAGLHKFDLNKPSVLTTFDYDGSTAYINQTSKFLTLGSANGALELFDPIGNEVIKSFQGHNGLLSDMDVQGSYIATCGYSVRPRRFNSHTHHQDFVVDPLVNIYDVRMMRLVSPIPFPAGATSVRFHPKLPNIIIIASTTGQMQFVDIYDQTNVHLYQSDFSQSQQVSASPKLSHLEVSDNGEFLAFSDSKANVHAWSLNNTGGSKDFVNFPANIDQPDIAVPPNVEHMPVDSITPLSTVGMPYYKDLLLSNWANDLKFTKNLARLPDPIDHDLLIEHETPKGFFPYDKLKYGPRNVMRPFQSLKERGSVNSMVSKPKFISERSPASPSSNGLSRTTSNSSQDNFETSDSNELLKASFSQESEENDSIFQYKAQSKNLNSPNKTALNKIPNCYTRLQIQYSKFGIKDFDFSYYNRTGGLYCGLENHTDNSYINALIQLFRFQPQLYNCVTSKLIHEYLPSDYDTILTRQNPQGSSILNELGYLFDMMHKASDKNVKIYNFSQALNHNRDAKLQGLININEGEGLNSKDLRNLIVKFNKFLVNQLNNDLQVQFQDSSIEDLMKIEHELIIKGNGGSCPTYERRTGFQFSLDLVTPPSNVLNKLSILLNPQLANKNQAPVTPATTRKNHNLLTYLEYSLNQYHSSPCQQHQHQYPHTLEIKSTVIKLPPVLCLNINFTNEEFRLVNSFKKLLVPEFYTINNRNRISVKSVVSSLSQGTTKYELMGYICEISHQSELSSGYHNLVTYVKIDSKWYLFNDFLVMPIPEEEVFNVSYSWKKPIILLYQDVTLGTNFNYFKPENFNNIPELNDSILYRDHFAGTIRESYKKEYELLTREEAPTIGSLVAIDAEFVSLSPEELEVHSDGTKKLIKPKELSLARMSALRGDNGPLQGKAFIDDYIVHTREIHDYLTSFSGIEPNDLDPIKSEKNLVTLQTAYRKLWLLLNLGVVFVGHGLYNDFRCINLQVPSVQIRDTAEFFYKSDFKRQLGLKFLAYVLLKEKVQTGNHDSIEDAHTALLLYKKYVELTATGTFEQTLNYIYSEGQQLRFRVPE